MVGLFTLLSHVRRPLPPTPEKTCVKHQCKNQINSSHHRKPHYTSIIFLVIKEFPCTLHQFCIFLIYLPSMHTAVFSVSTKGFCISRAGIKMQIKTFRDPSIFLQDLPPNKSFTIVSGNVKCVTSRILFSTCRVERYQSLSLFVALS